MRQSGFDRGRKIKLLFWENKGKFEAMASETMILKESGASLILTSGATGRVNALFSLRALKSLLVLINAVVLLLLLPFRGRRRISTTEKPRKEEKQIDCHRKGAMVRVPASTIMPWKTCISVSSSSSSTMTTTPVKAVAARRETAIKKVVEDNNLSTLRAYWLLMTRRGETIFTQSWTPVSVKIRYMHAVIFSNSYNCMFLGEFLVHSKKKNLKKKRGRERERERIFYFDAILFFLFWTIF